MRGLDGVAQRIGLVIVGSQDGVARRFVAWGREIEYVVLETGAVRASALVDDEVMATSTRTVEWMQQLMRRAKADQLAAAAALAKVPSRFRGTADPGVPAVGPGPTTSSQWQARLDGAPDGRQAAKLPAPPGTRASRSRL
jgi:hypothetical protein